MKIILSCLVTVLLCAVMYAPAQVNPSSFTNKKQKAVAAPTAAKPVTYFNATVQKDRVKLNWAVENNKETDRFEVERSADGKTFAMIALVFGSELTGLAEYGFYEKLKKTKCWYRLKVIYKNNKTEYSNIIMPGSDPASN